MKKKTLVMVSVILLVCEILFFRNIIANDGMIGDRGDGRLCMLFTEHVFQTICGHESFSDLLIFYPQHGTVAYSDILLAYGLIHSVFRSCGLDMFFSYKLTLIFIHFFGTASMYVLLRKKLKCSDYASLVGTIIFSFAPSLSYSSGHTQLFSVCFLPLIMYFVCSFFQELHCPAKRRIAAVIAITLLVLLAYTAWYIFFFTAFFCAVFLVVYAILLRKNEFRIVTETTSFIKAVRYELLAYIGYAILLMIPFVLLYIPVLRNSGGKSWEEVLFGIPEVADLLNTSTDNLVLGKLLQKLGMDSRAKLAMEISSGFSLIVALSFLYSFVFTHRNFKENKRSHLAVALSSTCWTIAITILFTVQVSSNGVSLWRFFFKFLPGAGTIRALGRYWLFLIFPVAIVIALNIEKILDSKCRAKYRIFVKAALLCLIILFNYDRNGVYSEWNRTEELTFLTQIAPPPSDCTVFYLNSSQKNIFYPFAQTDAFEIGAYYSLKTINGYSGVFPPGWWGCWEIGSESYTRSIQEWVSLHNIQNVYCYDIDNNTWTHLETVE